MEDTNINVLYIGSGPMFPINLTEKNGNLGWFISEGNLDLVKQNLVTYFNTPLHSRFRDGDYGNRLHTILEEPNTNVLRRLVRDWVISGIKSWEPRLKSLEINLTVVKEGLLISISGQIGTIPVKDLTFYYNKQNNQFYVNS